MTGWWTRLQTWVVESVAGAELRANRSALQRRHLDYVRLREEYMDLQGRYANLKDRSAADDVLAPVIGPDPLTPPTSVADGAPMVQATLEASPSNAGHTGVELLSYVLARMLDGVRGHEFQAKLSEIPEFWERLAQRKVHLQVNTNLAGDTVTAKLGNG